MTRYTRDGGQCPYGVKVRTFEQTSATTASGVGMDENKGWGDLSKRKRNIAIPNASPHSQTLSKLLYCACIQIAQLFFPLISTAIKCVRTTTLYAQVGYENLE